MQGSLADFTKSWLTTNEDNGLLIMLVYFEQYRAGFFESDTQAKMLGRDLNTFLRSISLLL